MTLLEEFLRNSNAIEGVKDDKSYEQALVAWEYLMTKKKMTEGVIQKTHKILMLNQKLLPNEKGYYRRIPVYIGSRAGLDWSHIPTTMSQWILNVNDLIENGKNENPYFLATAIKRQHVEYEKIHPFVDGNGRTGRMFLNWSRIQLGMPLLIIHTGEEQQKYYGWFK